MNTCEVLVSSSGRYLERAFPEGVIETYCVSSHWGCITLHPPGSAAIAEGLLERWE